MTPRPWLSWWAGGLVEWLGGNPPKQARVDQEAADSPGNAISRRSLALLDHHHLIFIVILVYMNRQLKAHLVLTSFGKNLGLVQTPAPSSSWSKNINVSREI